MQRQRVFPETFLIMAFQLTWLFTLAGCYRTNCPGYPDEYMKWIPYMSGAGITFTDGTDTMRLYVTEAYRSKPHKEATWIIEPFCYVEAYTILSGDTALPEIIVHSLYMNDPNEMAEYNYTFNGNSIRDADNNILYYGYAGFSFQATQNKITVNYHEPVSLLTSFYNGYKDYANVLKLESDTVLNYYKPWVYQVWIAESVGIIQFSELKTKKVWSLIEE